MTQKECCKVNAIISIDAKGQIVLPKELREKANLKPNDKIAVIGCEKDNQVCCIIMMKAEALGETVKNTLGPVLKDILK